jgi:hypothetical protein
MLNTESIALKTGATPRRRYVVLVVVLLCGAVMLNLILAAQHPPAGPEWPTQSDIYALSGWQTGSPVVESAWGISHISRPYRAADGSTATLVLSTSPEAKSLYKSGADLSFVGAGYSVQSVAPDLVAPAPGRAAEIVKRERETLLLIYTFGERRGLLGNGWLGWTMYGLDTLVGRPNDYYLLRVIAPLTASNATLDAVQAVQLADTVFPRVATWYATQ